jgi:pantetheine-phosphate adenylyltransferase
MSKNLAIYPGTFDPIHNGHLEIVRRGLGVFRNIIIAIGVNPGKTHMFTLQERYDMINDAIADDYPRIICGEFNGLLVDYARKVGARAILRGLRAVSDFEFEFQLSLMNRKLNKEIETYYLMTAHRYLYLSSTIIKATAGAGGMPTALKDLLPSYAYEKLKEKLRKD